MNAEKQKTKMENIMRNYHLKYYLIVVILMLFCPLGQTKNVSLTVETKNQTYAGTLDTDYGTFKIENISFKKLEMLVQQLAPAPWTCDQVDNYLKKGTGVPIPDSIYTKGQTLVQFDLFEVISNHDDFLSLLKTQTVKYGVDDPVIESIIQVSEATVKPIFDSSSIFVKATLHHESQDFLYKSIAFAIESERKNNENGVWPNRLGLPSAFVYCDAINNKINFELSLDFTIENTQKVKDSVLNFSQVMSVGQSMSDYLKSEKSTMLPNDVIVLRARQLEKSLAKKVGNKNIIDNNMFLNFWRAMFEVDDGPFTLTDLRARDLIRYSTETKLIVKKMKITLFTNQEKTNEMPIL